MNTLAGEKGDSTGKTSQILELVYFSGWKWKIQFRPLEL